MCIKRAVSVQTGQERAGSFLRKDKGQRAQTEAEEAPAEPEEELLPSEGDGALAQAAQGGCGWAQMVSQISSYGI